jgi:MYXO-CTERM domain-containing protein
MKRLPLAPLVLAGCASLLWPAVAKAHFVLSSPASWANQDTSGGPQKSAPCGQADPGTPAVVTGAVTTFHPGDTVTITLTETVFHPGHYRVALADTQAQLPADPPVTAGGSACGSTVIQNPPVFPVLADGMLVHTAQLSGPQTFTVTLPAGMTCTKCTLQVEEFMSSHPLNIPGGCFYHHCADISIQAAGTGNDAGTDAGTQAVPFDNGCGCSVAHHGSPLVPLLLTLPVLLGVLRRRRRAL